MSQKKDIEKQLQTDKEEARFVAELHLRLRESEHRVLKAKADEYGCNISQVARMMLFKRISFSIDKLSEKDVKHRRFLAIKSMRAEFSKIATSFTNFVESYRRSTQLLNRNGDPAVDTEQTLRMVSTLESQVLKLQSSVNTVLHEEGMNELYPIARTFPPFEDGSEENTELDSKYSNMERIMIIGKLSEDASKYTSGKGNEKIRMKVCCESAGKAGAKVVREYSVFFRDLDVFPLLKEGKSVFVEGSFTQDDKKENLVFADILKFAEE